jgi:hypothetical protein
MLTPRKPFKELDTANCSCARKQPTIQDKFVHIEEECEDLIARRLGKRFFTKVPRKEDLSETYKAIAEANYCSTLLSVCRPLREH